MTGLHIAASEQDKSWWFGDPGKAIMKGLLYPPVQDGVADPLIPDYLDHRLFPIFR
jgi:hypothetical protein